MRYYVTADVHGYSSELKDALTAQGFFDDQSPHKLIVCGDLYDRGTEALQLQTFILELLDRDQVILIRGNHEDLTMNLLNNWHRRSYLQTHHHTNGTIDTLCQLTGISIRDIYTDAENVGRSILKDPYIQKIIPAMVDYYETDHYMRISRTGPVNWLVRCCESPDCCAGQPIPTVLTFWIFPTPWLWMKRPWPVPSLSADILRSIPVQPIP